MPVGRGKREIHQLRGLAGRRWRTRSTPTGLANLPAYLDIEDDVLLACASAVEPKAVHTIESAQAWLIDAVLPTINFGSGRRPQRGSRQP